MKRVIFLFPGQGSQKIGMGKDFFDNLAIAKEMIEVSSDRLKIDFKKLLFKENEDINKTEFTQSAILLISSIANRAFKDSIDIKPVYSLGHSLGEFSALVSIEALNPIDGVELVYNRGKFMSEAAKGVDGGMMVVLGLKDEIVEEICKDARDEGKRVWPANYNSDGQIVVAGIKDDLKSLESIFKEKGAKRAMLLNMSVASHCPLLEDARKSLREFLEKFIKDNFISPVISNVTAKPYSSKKEAVELLDRQLIEPVLYKQSIKNVESECDLFIEFGEGGVLKGLNRRLTKVPTISVSDMRSLESALDMLNG